MIAKILVLSFLAISLLMLIRSRLIQVELLFPALVAVFALGLLSTIPSFVDYLGILFQIGYAPIASLFVVIFLVFWIIVVLAIAITRIRERQRRTILFLVLDDLERAENARHEETGLLDADRTQVSQQDRGSKNT